MHVRLSLPSITRSFFHNKIELEAKFLFHDRNEAEGSIVFRFFSLLPFFEAAQTPLTTFLEPKPCHATRTSLAQRRITSGSGALVRRRVVRATGSGVYVVSNTAEGRTLALAWRFVARSLGM